MIEIVWGNFQSICQAANVPVCWLWNPLGVTQRICEPVGISGLAFSRHIVDIITCGVSFLIMLYPIFRSYRKKAAVGRREINIFFCWYLLVLVCQVLSVDMAMASIDPTRISLTRPLFMKIACCALIGLAVIAFWVLLLNGFVGFQWVDDGRPLSFFGILVSAVLLAAGLSTLSYDLTMSLFGGLLGQVPYESVYLYGVYFITPLACILIYLIAQIVLVAGNLGDQKPLINLGVALVFFIGGQVCMFLFNTELCQLTERVTDGAPFQTLFNTIAVFFVFRFWDSITEDEIDDKAAGFV